ncbi:hypothetical protein [uncultured Pseudodesulfovibrio sp.]|uniref:hypothetical protein n=1 Tax=uncultured Pseudodesulfovibrio sp. TaxID=2035858 RepID=UPI0029C8B481|nr:hypothetical protein [uncultured Pseudodesulfovibrio sp.]
MENSLPAAPLHLAVAVSVTVPAVVGVVRVMAVRAMVMHVLTVRIVLVCMAVGMGMHVTVLMRMCGAVLMGVFVHMGMFMFVIVVMNCLPPVSMLMGFAILVEIATAGLTHMSLLTLGFCLPSLLNPTPHVLKNNPARK